MRNNLIICKRQMNEAERPLILRMILIQKFYEHRN